MGLPAPARFMAVTRILRGHSARTLYRIPFLSLRKTRPIHLNGLRIYVHPGIGINSEIITFDKLGKNCIFLAISRPRNKVIFLAMSV